MLDMPQSDILQNDLIRRGILFMHCEVNALGSGSQYYTSIGRSASFCLFIIMSVLTLRLTSSHIFQKGSCLEFCQANQVVIYSHRQGMSLWILQCGMEHLPA